MDLFDGFSFPVRVLFGFVPMVCSLALHEFGHAASAVALGDDTPRAQGRLTLNPLAHIDLVGTVLLPLALIALHQPVFGWAKPVVISPYRFTRSIRMSTGLMLTAAAGPAMNLLLALGASVVLHALGPGRGASTATLLVAAGATQLLALNILLCLFNLIPLPPLDGSRVLGGLLPRPFARLYGRLEGLSPLFLGLLFFTGLGGQLLAGPSLWLAGLLDDAGRLLTLGPA